MGCATYLLAVCIPFGESRNERSALGHRPVIGAFDRDGDRVGHCGRAVGEVHIKGDFQHIAVTQPVQRSGAGIIDTDGLRAASGRLVIIDEGNRVRGKKRAHIRRRRASRTAVWCIAGGARAIDRSGQSISSAKRRAGVHV